MHRFIHIINPDDCFNYNLDFMSGDIKEIGFLKNTTIEKLLTLIEEEYSPETIITICDHADNSEKGFGFGYKLAKAIRIYSYINGKESSIQKASILIYGIFNFRQYIDRNPKHVLVTAPGIYYISILDLKNPLPPLSIRTINNNQLLATQEYLIDVPNFNKKFNRHIAASTFGLNVIRTFVRLRYRFNSLLPIGWFPPLSFLRQPSSTQVDSSLQAALFSYEQKAYQTMGYNIKNEANQIDDLISTIQSQINNSDIKIAIIDDEAVKMSKDPNGKIGWKHAISTLLFSKTEIILDVLGQLPDIDYQIDERNFDTIADIIESQNIGCVLLDVHLDRNNRRRGIANKIGTLLLKYLRKRFPTLPIIIITATNKPWKHRYLMSSQADAVWVKEGFDEGRTPIVSYYNIIRLLKLLKQVTSSKYQFLYKLGNEIKQLHNPKKSFWWIKTPLSWPNGNAYDYSEQLSTKVHHPNFRNDISNLLSDIQHLLRNFLQQTELQFNEATGGDEKIRMEANAAYSVGIKNGITVKIIAESIVIQIGKVIEIIHGQQKMASASNYHINSRLIGGGRDKNFSYNYKTKRGDWIAYWLYQHRNECAHYFEGLNYDLFSNSATDRSLAMLLSTLIAYLGSKQQPSHSKNSRHLNSCNSKDPNRKVVPDFIDKYIKNVEDQENISSFAKIYYDLIKKFK